MYSGKNDSSDNESIATKAIRSVARCVGSDAPATLAYSGSKRFLPALFGSKVVKVGTTIIIVGAISLAVISIIKHILSRRD